MSDTQTGLRAIPTEALKILATIKGDRFEYETNMLLALPKNDIAWEEIKIRTVYLEENKSSHFRAVKDSWRIYKLILAHFFRYTLSSVVSALLDEGLFALFSFLLHTVLSGFLLTAIPTFTARLISSLVNFVLNKKLVFHSHGQTGKALLRYYALAVPMLVLQCSLTYGSFLLFGIQPEQVVLRAIIYAIVMAMLFVISFSIQQRWVFHTNQKSTPKLNEANIHD